MAKFYGIEGELDEYKEKELNRIGNNAFILTSIYSFISTLFCFLSFDQFGQNHLMILISVNMIVYFLLIPAYTATAIKFSGLTEIDMDETEYSKARQNSIFRSILSSFIYIISMCLFTAGTNFIFDNVPIKRSLTDLNSLVSWLIGGIIFGVILLFSRLKTLKKALKNSQEE